MATLTINGATIETDAGDDTPLLYVLTDELQLQGPRFGCGLAQCGSCSVLVDGVETRACVTPISLLANKDITTLEGITSYYYNGMIIKGTELLLNNPAPTEAEIRSAMNGHLCRCGTYPKIISAILRAADAMATAKISGADNQEETA